MRAYIHARLSPQERRDLDVLREATGQSESELVRQGLQRMVHEHGRRRSALDLAEGSIGKFTTTLKDLSTDKEHLEGFGR